MSAPVQFPRFFVTASAPCPYLPGKQERKVFTEIGDTNADELNDALGRIGFRRSQTVAYRPSCANCQACVAVRVVADQFELTSSQRRVLRRNSDIVTKVCRPWATEEQFNLLQRYLTARHPGGGMTEMTEFDYADMVEQTPVRSYVIEYREPASGGQEGRLIGACLTDHQSDGLSMIYSFYEPDHENRAGLGNYIILDHILRSRNAGLSYVYLGYWVEGSVRMHYKVRYRPLERLGPAGWVPFVGEDGGESAENGGANGSAYGADSRAESESTAASGEDRASFDRHSAQFDDLQQQVNDQHAQQRTAAQLRGAAKVGESGSGTSQREAAAPFPDFRAEPSGGGLDERAQHRRRANSQSSSDAASSATSNSGANSGSSFIGRKRDIIT